MEITYKTIMNKIPFLLVLLCLFTNCSKDTADAEPTNYDYFYPSDEASITAAQIGAGTGTLDPKGITIANEKLYVCNGDVLEVFNAVTLAYIKTITGYTKGTTTIPFTKISSVAVDNGRIYVGSVDSRLFVLDENTNAGINTVGNGQWWTTFVHVFGIVVKDGLIFVKEKETSVKVFETSQITDTSDWNLKPLAKLNTLYGFDQIYSMDIEAGNLVVAGRDAISYLYYDIAAIKAGAVSSLTEPIKPVVSELNTKPIAVNFSKDWAVTSENIGTTNYLRIYPKADFMARNFNATVNVSDIMGQNSFGSILGIAQLNDRLFLSDNTNKKIRVLKLNKSVIAEQK
ncbi:hypothetical protein BC749_10471 [Flavobacterium araucananum]|uniref:Uncharacterized protein n=1 Tax=Flavobacterium araucananum TaxID=946678 RepID=A0A227NFR6_9FLAO|nr:PQQ-binding-like beta-propeller repeat protein [Flavobacterium araucananum]OXE96513.1 hypothetical protein B0A64_23860 [Flavobacterium araucananum]PWJ98927.1 hypothetical protein BC749_10471 [Flavobacterium araucananum]